jgi:hypothetical protein
MDLSLALNGQGRSHFDRLYSDIKFALNDLTTQELTDIFVQSSTLAVKITWQSKKRAAINAYEFAKKHVNRYKTEGVLNSLQNDITKAGIFVSELPEKSRLLYDKFIALPKDKKIEVVAITILTAAIFFATAGGSDIEGGLPDADIAVGGIGVHRNIISHSILIGLGVEFTGRFGILVLSRMRDRLPDNPRPAWGRVYLFLDNNKELAIAAMWAGLGLHLLKDSGLITGGFKPYTGIPTHLSAQTHKGLFAANGIASGIFTGDGIRSI